MLAISFVPSLTQQFVLDLMHSTPRSRCCSSKAREHGALWKDWALRRPRPGEPSVRPLFPQRWRDRRKLET